MALTGVQHHLHAGDFEATIVEVGAGLRQLRHRDRELTPSYSEHELPPKGAGATLVPWPNRIRGGRYRFGEVDYQLPLTEPATGNAIHGLARWARWERIGGDEAAVTLGIDLVPQTGWLFEVRVEVEYALDPVAGLTVTLRAVNHGSGAAPFGAGFHPYLSVHGHELDEVSITLPAGQRLVTDAVFIPVDVAPVEGTPYDLRAGAPLGGLRLDDGFTDLAVEDGRTTVAVRTPSGGAELWMDAAFGFVQVFTPQPWSGGQAAVAVEPMTGPADAFNSGRGLIVLEPGSDWTARWGIRLLA